MEVFLQILPFLVIVLIGKNLYHSFKNKDRIEKELTWLEQKPLFQYLKLVFIVRTRYRTASFLFFLPMWFCIFFGAASLYVNLTEFIYPPVALEKMQIQQGIIKSITIRKKMDDLLVLKTDSGTLEKYAFRLNGSIEKYIDKNVRIYYSRGFSSAYTIDNRIYQINEIGNNNILEKYNYKRHLEVNQMSRNFTRNFILIGVFSAFMVWFLNKKELPIHRLNRIKMRKIREIRDARYKKLFAFR